YFQRWLSLCRFSAGWAGSQFLRWNRFDSHNPVSFQSDALYPPSENTSHCGTIVKEKLPSLQFYLQFEIDSDFDSLFPGVIKFVPSQPGAN
ncbi:MAG: hypothetical protein AB1531_06385, partial [Chloroflexota bacterium]